MNQCIYCSTKVDEKFNFCINCEKQLKCVKCNSWLIKNKSKCFVCGTPLVIEDPVQNPVNRYSLEETYTKTTYSRKISVEATDEAIGKIAPALGGVSQHLSAKASTRFLSPNTKNQLVLPLTAQDERVEERNEFPDEENALGESSVAQQSNSVNILDEQTTIHDYFTKDSKGYLISNTPDYKGSNMKEQQDRYILLYIGAYQKIVGEPVPSKEHLIISAKQNKLYDSNTTRYLTRLGSYITNVDKTYALNPAGKKFFDKIISELHDENKVGYDKNTGSKAKVTRTTISSTTLLKIESWVNIPSRFSSIDVRDVKPTNKLCILALYDITKELKVESAVSPIIAYEYLLKRYKTLPFDKQTFAKSLTSKKSTKYFLKVQDGKYCTTSIADGIAEELISHTK